MDPLQEQQLTAIERLEYELVVRDFTSLVNDGCFDELDAFLHPEVTYQPAPRQFVAGRRAVVAMLKDMHDSFEECTTTLLDVAVTHDVVLTEQQLRLRLPALPAQSVIGFSSYRLDGFQIAEWHQVLA